MSLLPSLSPLAAILLAVSLAYYRLEPFQYWKQIRAHAADTWKKLPPGVQAHEETEYYKRIGSLAGEVQGSEAGRIPGVMGWIFWILFNTGADRMLSVGMSVLALALVILGSAHATRRLLWLASWFDGDRILWPLITLSSLTAFSVALMFLGDWYVSKAREVIDANAKELSKHVTAGASSAKIQVSKNPT